MGRRHPWVHTFGCPEVSLWILLFDLPEDRVGVGSQVMGDLQELDDIQPALPALVFGHERLRLPQLGGELGLGQIRRSSSLLEEGKQVSVRVRVEGVHVSCRMMSRPSN